MIKVGIYGPSEVHSPVRKQLLRLLLRHPDVDLRAVASTAGNATPLAELHPVFAGETSLTLERVLKLDGLDVLFVIDEENLTEELLAKYADFDVKYEGVAKFPAVTRDISLVMKKTVLAGQVEEVIRDNGGKLLEDYHLFDIYEGENVAADEKSLAYSIRFRAKDRTLEDKDVTTVMDKILKKLESLGVSLRQ